MSSQVNVRFLTVDEDQDVHAPRQTVSVHVGALRLERGGGEAGGSGLHPPPHHHSPQHQVEMEMDDSSYSESRNPDGEESLDDDDNLLIQTGSPKLSWDLMLLILFSGSGWGVLAVLVALSFLFGIPFGMIIIGAVYTGIESCFDDRIAILLILGGILSILSVLTRATVTNANAKTKKDRRGHHHEHNHVQGHPHHRPRQWGHDEPIEPDKSFSFVRFLHGMISVVDCVWLVVTSIFVYRIWTTVELDDEKSEMYCARTLYLFSFIYLTVVWVIFAMSLFYMVMAMLRSCICVCNV